MATTRKSVITSSYNKTINKVLTEILWWCGPSNKVQHIVPHKSNYIRCEVLLYLTVILACFVLFLKDLVSFFSKIFFYLKQFCLAIWYILKLFCFVFLWSFIVSIDVLFSFSYFQWFSFQRMLMILVTKNLLYYKITATAVNQGV